MSIAAAAVTAWLSGRGSTRVALAGVLDQEIAGDENRERRHCINATRPGIVLTK